MSLWLLARESQSFRVVAFGQVNLISLVCKANLRAKYNGRRLDRDALADDGQMSQTRAKNVI